jgi:hypothetical protein
MTFSSLDFYSRNVVPFLTVLVTWFHYERIKSDGGYLGLSHTHTVVTVCGDIEPKCLTVLNKAELIHLEIWFLCNCIMKQQDEPPGSNTKSKAFTAVRLLRQVFLQLFWLLTLTLMIPLTHILHWTIALHMVCYRPVQPASFHTPRSVRTSPLTRFFAGLRREEALLVDPDFGCLYNVECGSLQVWWWIQYVPSKH